MPTSYAEDFQRMYDAQTNPDIIAENKRKADAAKRKAERMADTGAYVV